MPQNKYTDADLPRFNQKLGIQFVDEDESVAPIPPYEQDGPTADELLNDAKRTLDHSNALAKEHNTANLANLQTRLSSLSQGPRPSVSGAVGSITKPMHGVGSAMMGMALPAAGASWMIPGAPAMAGGLMAAGSALAAPDVLRRLISPDQAQAAEAGAPLEDESRGEAALEAGLLASPQLYQGAKAGVNAVRGAMDARTVARFRNAMRGGDAIPRPSPLPGNPTKFSLGRETPYQNTEPVNTARSLSRQYAPQQPAAGAGIIDGEIIDDLALGGQHALGASPSPAGLLPESTQLRMPSSSLRQALGLPEATQIRLPPSSGGQPPSQALMRPERRMAPRPRLPQESMPGVRNVLDEVIAPTNSPERIQQLTSKFDDAMANLPEEDFMSSLPDVPEPTFVDYEGSALAPFVANGSGESSASVEALNRLRSMAGKNERFAVRRRGATRDLIGPDAVDYTPGTDEEFGILRDGLFQVLSRGARR